MSVIVCMSSGKLLIYFIYLFIILFFQKRKGWHQKARLAQGCFLACIYGSNRTITFNKLVKRMLLAELFLSELFFSLHCIINLALEITDNLAARLLLCSSAKSISYQLPKF